MFEKTKFSGCPQVLASVSPSVLSRQKRGGLRTGKLRDVRCGPKAPVAVWAGWAGRWGPPTRAVTQRDRSRRESCTCDVCAHRTRSSRHRGRGARSRVSELVYCMAVLG